MSYTWRRIVGGREQGIHHVLLESGWIPGVFGSRTTKKGQETAGREGLRKHKGNIKMEDSNKKLENGSRRESYWAWMKKYLQSTT